MQSNFVKDSSKRELLHKLLARQVKLEDEIASAEDYKLVYRSGQIARKLPGTNTDFTLQAFKKDYASRGYDGINLYLMLYSTSDLNSG